VSVGIPTAGKLLRFVQSDLRLVLVPIQELWQRGDRLRASAEPPVGSGDG